MYLAAGSECCIDSAKCIASRAVRGDVRVVWEEYEGLCHDFPVVFPEWRVSEVCFGRCAGFVRDCVGRGEVRTRGVVIGLEDLAKTEVDVRHLSSVGPKRGGDYARGG
jgi:hypothetical protein